ncbi:MAG: ComEC family competence protein [Pseudomonadota bacterium]|nr:ComEC family competence protein [Pseudomonadota bacterium]
MPTNDASAPSIAATPLQTVPHRPAWLPLSRLGDHIEGWLEAERDQLPLLLPVALGFGIAAWFVLPGSSAWTAFLLISCAGAVAALAAPPARWSRALLLFCVAAAIGCGLVWSKADRLAAPRLERQQAAEFEAIIESVQRLPAKEAVRLLVQPLVPADLAKKLRINVDWDDAPPGIEPGARVRIRAWLMPPPPMPVPGAYDFARAAWFQQIGGTGRAHAVEVIERAGEQGWRARLANARQRLADHVRAQLPGSQGGIAAALATGDQSGIPEEDAEAMRRSGLAHLLSVSGLHLTAVVGAVMLLTLKILALSPWLALRFRLVLIAAAAGAFAGVGYTLLTGAEVPTVRACIAALLVLLGIALGREALTLRLVAVAALAVLAFWPESLVGPSFQMSFAAMIAIVALHEHPQVKALLSRRDEGPFARLGRGLLALVLTGLVVEIALVPIALYHFHKAGLYGAIANILAIPLTTFIIMPAEALALLLDSIGLGAPFWWAAGAGLELLLALARTTAAAPGAVTMLPTMPPAAFGLMVAGGLWLALWRTKIRRLGLLPAGVGALWAISTPPADLIVTGDGRHLALRGPSGEMAILRGRAGEYVRSMLGETSGSEAEMPDVEAMGGARCNGDLCVIDIGRDGRRWRILATRSRHLVDFAPLSRACGQADIVISDRRLPRTCRPRWLKADRPFLARTGGLAVTLSETPAITTVAERVGRHPWARPSR